MTTDNLLSHILSLKENVQIIEHNVATLDASDVYLYDYLKLYVEEITKLQHQVDRLYTDVRNGKFPKEMGFEYNIARRFTLKHLEAAAVLLNESELYDYPFLVDHGKKIDLQGFSLAKPIAELEAAANGTQDEKRLFEECRRIRQTFDDSNDSLIYIYEQGKLESHIFQLVNSILEEEAEGEAIQNRYADLVLEIQEQDERIKALRQQQLELQKEQKRQELLKRKEEKEELKRFRANQLNKTAQQTKDSPKQKEKTASKKIKKPAPNRDKPRPQKPKEKTDEVVLKRTRDFRNFLLAQGFHPDVLHGIMASIHSSWPPLMKEFVDKNFKSLFEYTDITQIETWIADIDKIKEKDEVNPHRITFFNRWLKQYVVFLKS